MPRHSWPTPGAIREPAPGAAKPHLKTSCGQSAPYRASHEAVGKVSGLHVGDKPRLYVVEALPITSTPGPTAPAHGTIASPHPRKSPRARLLSAERTARPLFMIHDLASGAVNAVA